MSTPTPVWLVLDQGGHGSRAALIDADARVRAQAQRPVATRTGAGGVVEQDPIELLDSLREAIAEVATAADNAHLRVEAAGLACQRASIVCWDRVDGRCLSPVLSWADTRAGVLLAAAKLDADAVRTSTGLRPSPHYGASKLAWCRQHLAEVARALDAGRLGWGPLASWLLFALLAERPYRVPRSIAQRTLLYALDRDGWSPSLLAAFDLPIDSLPLCVPDFGTHGTLACGSARVPLVACAGDQNLVPFAFGPLDAHALYMNAGTGAFLLRPLTSSDPVAPELLRTLLDDPAQPCFALEATINGAGSAFDLLAERLPGAGPNLPGLKDIVAPAPDWPLFLNGVGGLGSPWWRPDFPSRWLPDTDHPLHASYAVTESIAFLSRRNLEAMHGLPKPQRLLLGGGLSRSGLLCRLLAAALEMPVVRACDDELTVRGLYRQLRGIRGGAVALHAPIAPDPVLCAALAPRYAGWLAAMERLLRG